MGLERFPSSFPGSCLLISGIFIRICHWGLKADKVAQLVERSTVLDTLSHPWGLAGAPNACCLCVPSDQWGEEAQAQGSLVRVFLSFQMVLLSIIPGKSKHIIGNGKISSFLWLSNISFMVTCSHEIKRCLLLGGIAMTNLDSILKSGDITLPTKVRIVKAVVFPVVVYGCESWTVKKAECQRIDAFGLWCWRRLLRVP